MSVSLQFQTFLNIIFILYNFNIYLYIFSGFTGGRFLKKKREEELITKIDNFKELSSPIDPKGSQIKKSN